MSEQTRVWHKSITLIILYSQACRVKSVLNLASQLSWLKSKPRQTKILSSFDSSISTAHSKEMNTKSSVRYQVGNKSIDE
jgi:hypothetical protein